MYDWDHDIRPTPAESRRATAVLIVGIALLMLAFAALGSRLGYGPFELLLGAAGQMDWTDARAENQSPPEADHGESVLSVE